MRFTLLTGVLAFALASITLTRDSRGPTTADLEKKGALASQEKRWDDAAAAYRELTKLDEKNGQAWYRLGYALQMSGKFDEAIEAHLKTASFPRFKPEGLYNVGGVYAMKKDKDKAFENLMKAADAGFGNVDNLTEDADLKALHDDPRWERFDELLAKARSGV